MHFKSLTAWTIPSWKILSELVEKMYVAQEVSSNCPETCCFRTNYFNKEKDWTRFLDLLRGGKLFFKKKNPNLCHELLFYFLLKGILTRLIASSWTKFAFHWIIMYVSEADREMRVEGYEGRRKWVGAQLTQNSILLYKLFMFMYFPKADREMGVKGDGGWRKWVGSQLTQNSMLLNKLCIIIATQISINVI